LQPVKDKPATKTSAGSSFKIFICMFFGDKKKEYIKYNATISGQLKFLKTGQPSTVYG
jgi:hypothetical protein